MPFDAPDIRLGGIAPEIVLSAGALLLLLFDAFLGDRLTAMRRSVRPARPLLPVLSTLILGLAGTFAFDAWQRVAERGPRLQLGSMIVEDGFATFVKILLVIFALLTVWAARDYLVREGTEEAEFYALVLFATAGMMLMASAADLLVLFIALETFSLSLYVLVGFRRRGSGSQESALKYFLLGSFSSAFLLLGIALAYGAVGSTNLYSGSEFGDPEGIVQFLRTTPAAGTDLLILAAGLLVVGLAFKIAAVPFHMWTPDAYQGAPAPVTGFMAAATKLAAFAAMLRLFDAVLLPLKWDWQPLLIGLAVVTMVAGSVLAVVQEDLKRVLAYSSIAHAGFLLIGLVAASDRGVSGTLFYLAVYGASVLGAFAVIAVVAGEGERRIRLSDLRGLFLERPVLAAALTLFLLSLAGVPLTAGFVGKLLVFSAAVETGYAWLVVVGAGASAIAAFFYLRVLVVMYMEESEQIAAPAPMGPLSGVVIGITALATLGLGILWGPLARLAEEAQFFVAGG